MRHKWFALRQFWRTWLLNAKFPISEVNQGEYYSAELIVQPMLPPWVEEMSAAGKSETHQGLRAAISEMLCPVFAKTSS